jgi:hypothetical protein
MTDGGSLGPDADLSALSNHDLCRWALTHGMPGVPERVRKQAITLTEQMRFSLYELGSGRVVLTDHDRQYVYKLAFTPHGERTSEAEASGAIEAPVAAAQWVQAAGFRVLRMEHVEAVSDDRLSDIDIVRYPWVPLVDDAQVGWTTAGTLVCFDAGQFGEHNRGMFHHLLQRGAAGAAKLSQSDNPSGTRPGANSPLLVRNARTREDSQASDEPHATS